MIVLGIETSCDETGIALYDSEQGLLADALFSQVDMHARYGGVVPELASRDHIQRVIPLIHQVLRDADLSREHIDAIAYTKGPGLMGALLVGSTIGQTLAWAWGIPAIGVHHMEGHLLAPMMKTPSQQNLNTPQYPFLALLVSGGHTLLVDVKAHSAYQVLGESLDDAVGEAFDKTAKLLGLDYPGGPAIAKLAREGNPKAFTFPRPMTNRPGLDMSFSGLKTYVLNTWHQSDKSMQTRADIAASFQEAICDTLVIKCKRAMQQTGYRQLVIAGGVSANQQLRAKLQNLADEYHYQLFFPELSYCTDNGAMIAYAGLLRLRQGKMKENLDFQPLPRWDLSFLINE